VLDAKSKPEPTFVSSTSNSDYKVLILDYSVLNALSLNAIKSVFETKFVEIDPISPVFNLVSKAVTLVY